MKNKNKDHILYSIKEGKLKLLVNGTDVTSSLLRSGEAVVSEKGLRQKPRILAFQEEAIRSQRGVWLDAYQQEAILIKQAALQEMIAYERRGNKISVSQKSGLIQSGTVLSFKASFPSTFYVSQNGGNYAPLSGSLLASSDLDISFYAVPNLAYARAPEDFSTSKERRHYLILKDEYPDAVHISEVFPSPPKGGDEWIEFYNASDEDVNLGGWKLVDPAKKLLKAIPFDVKIKAKSYLVLSSKLTKFRLLNAGQRIELHAPNGQVMERMRYSKVKTGYSYSITNNSWGALMDKEKSDTKGCITTLPTLLKQNICKAPEVKKSVAKKTKKVKKSKAQKKPSKKSPKPPMELIDGLAGQLFGKGKIQASTSGVAFIVVIVAFIISLSAFLLIYWKKALKKEWDA